LIEFVLSAGVSARDEAGIFNDAGFKFAFAERRDEEDGALKTRFVNLATGVFGVIVKDPAIGLAHSLCIVMRLLRVLTTFGDAEGENKGDVKKGERIGDCIGERGGEGKKANVLFVQSDDDDDDDDDVELVLERAVGDNIIGGGIPFTIGGRVIFSDWIVGDTKPIGGALPSEIDGRIISIAFGGLLLICRRVCQRGSIIY
jgi:hypothetical protein